MMATITALRQLLRSLCHDTVWDYAVFWKLKRQSQILLIWEDGYCCNPKPGVIGESMPHCESFCSKPGIIAFGHGMDTHCISSAGRLIELAVANMSSHLHSLGEGIVGKVAITGKHRWIFSNELNSSILQEYPEEWQLQIAAGIKTVLLVPVVPHGVVQLGSLEMVMQDSTMVAHIKALFSTLQLVDTRNPFVSNEVSIKPSSPLITSLTRQFSVSSAVTGKDESDLYTEQVTKNRRLTLTSHLSPLFMVQDDLFVPDNIPQVHEMDMVLNTEMLGDDMSTFASASEFDAINQRLITEQSTRLNSFENDMQHEYDACYARDTEAQTFGKEAYEETNHQIDSPLLNFPINSELHKALGAAILPAHDDCAWNTTISGEDRLSSSPVACRTEESDSYKHLVLESNEWCMRESDGEHLLDAVIANLLYASEGNVSRETGPVRLPCKSSEKFVDYCPSQSNSEIDVLGPDDSDPFCSIKSTTFCRNQVAAVSQTDTSSKSMSILTSEENQNKDPGPDFYWQSAKSSHIGKGRVKSADNAHRPRPRDRQLIQDRVKELRELVPNGAKCSIDALLDQTIKHMLFLRSVSSRAEKLNLSTYPKDGSEDLDSSIGQKHQKGASWAYEVGRQPESCPIIVENLDQPGHMLVEMLCKEYGVFIEIAGVIRQLQLTILKGVMESRSNKLWARFIVEVSSGFHRMDILWPLMQLLQRSCSSPVPSKF